MTISPLNYSDPAKRRACFRLESQFEASIGEIDKRSVHVEIKPRWKASGFSQVIADADIAKIVKDVNTLGNVRVLDLTENDITDASLPFLKLLRNLKELWLTGTKMTHPAVALLKSASPKMRVSFDGPAPLTKGENMAKKKAPVAAKNKSPLPVKKSAVAKESIKKTKPAKKRSPKKEAVKRILQLDYSKRRGGGLILGVHEETPAAVIREEINLDLEADVARNLIKHLQDYLEADEAIELMIKASGY